MVAVLSWTLSKVQRLHTMQFVHAPLTRSESQDEPRALIEEHVVADQDIPSEPDHADDPLSDEEDLLQYAIMLSLQDNNGEDKLGNHVKSQGRSVSSVNPSTRPLQTKLPTNPHTGLTASMPSPTLLSLPLELKEMICAFVFTDETIVVKPSRVTSVKFIVTWGSHLSLLLACHEISSIATRFLKCGEVILDLRQFRIGMTGMGLSFEELLSYADDLRSVCSKLMIRQAQSAVCNEIRKTLPSLVSIELFDYKSCREAMREDGFYNGRIFEQAVPMMMKTRAADQLQLFPKILPSTICADLIYVCDTLVCIPNHEPNQPLVEDQVSDGNNDSSAKKTGEKKSIWKRFSRSSREPHNNDLVKQEDACVKRAPYKTAKLRHLILFNKHNPEGRWLSKDWVVAGLGVQSLSLGDMVAVHCHEYCLELIERGETVGV